MMEIVFSDSAAGSLQCARNYGRGAFPDGPIGVAVYHEDGREAAPEEIQEARARAEEETREKWEAAVPMDARAEDILGFSLALSQGPVAGDFWQGRWETLGRLFSCYPAAEGEEAAAQLITGGKKSLETLLERAKTDEALRVWYSAAQPDDLCGLCWLMAELKEVSWQGELFLVKLPAWEAEGDNRLTRLNSWGEVEPGQWSRYLPLQEKAPALLPRALAGEWRRLREENAPLRAIVSGKICGVGEDFYDPFLLRVLARAPEEFHEAALIGQVLGEYPLGIGDGWLALRVEELIRRGLLEPVTEAPADSPCYHRMLRKKFLGN